MAEREEFELGDEAIEVERARRSGIVLSVRLSADEAEQVQRLALERGMSLSQIAREALTGLLRGGAGGVAGAPVTAAITGPASLVIQTNNPWLINQTRAAHEADSGALRAAR